MAKRGDRIANEMARDAINALNRAKRARKIAEAKLAAAKEKLTLARNKEGDALAFANSRIAYAETFKETRGENLDQRRAAS